MTEGLRSITGLAKESLRGLKPADLSKDLPQFEHVDPRSLFVEEGYQRGIGENGIALIRSIYSEFQWARFKPPICVRRADLDGVLVCIDGQHTAMAAASHPGIKTIPVMIVAAESVGERAAAFVGHNKVRLSLTAHAIYRAEIASGDETAMAVDRACAAAGAIIASRSINLRDKHPVGMTIAISTMKVCIKRYSEATLAAALRVLIAASRGPVKATEISAVCMILAHHPDAGERLTKVVASKTAEVWAAMGASMSASTGAAIGSAVATLWCRELNVRLDPRLLKKPKPEAPPPPQFRPRPAPPPPPPPPRNFDADAAKLKTEIENILTESAPPKPVAQPAPQPQPKIEPKRQPITQVVRNGVKLSSDGVVDHRGSAVKLTEPAMIKIVNALLNVMPSLLDRDRLATKVAPAGTGKSDALAFVDYVITETNPLLRRVKLEIKSVKNIGHSLYDLGG